MNRATLVVDDAQWGTILVDGHVVTLPDKTYRLIRLLAQRPGECVPYTEIYAELWGDLIVESNQMHFQRGKLLKRVAMVAPGRAKLVTTVPKRGFRLNLTAKETAFRQWESKAV